MPRTLALRLAPFLVPLWVAAAPSLELQPGGRLWLEGDSTLHAYQSEASTFTVEFAWQGEPPRDLREALEAKAPATLTVRVPVAELKSEHKGLDKNLRKALSADRHPEIVFALDGYDVERGTAPVAVGRGRLTVAGRTREIAVRAALAGREDGLTLEGEHALLMTDFGVKPPSALLGAVKAKDRIVVKFRLDLRRKP